MIRGLTNIGKAAIVFGVLFAGWTEVAGSEFYEGKRLRIVVGYTPGGTFDVFTRLLARHISRHIQGNPVVIVQNMPGAASLVAANHVYEMQPGDGLTLVNFTAGHVLGATMGEPAIKFDPQKYIWIGEPSPGSVPHVLWVRPDVAESLDDLIKIKRPVNLGSTGPGAGSFAMAQFWRRIGLNINHVSGYKGTADIFAAIERGELDGIALSQAGVQSVFSRFLEERRIVPIVSLGDHPMVKPLPGLASFEDLKKKLKLTQENIALGTFMNDSNALVRLYAVPPGTPSERVHILRTAFMNSLQDPKLLVDADRLGVVVAPRSAEEVEERIHRLISTPQRILDIYKADILTK